VGTHYRLRERYKAVEQHISADSAHGCIKVAQPVPVDDHLLKVPSLKLCNLPSVI
jgi:hypothetical protein